MEATFPQSKPLGQPHSYQVAKSALKAVPGRVYFPLPAAYRAATVLYAPATAVAVAVKPEAGGRSPSSLSPPGGKGEFWQGFRSWALGTTRKPATLFLQASSGVLGPRLSGERRYSGGRRGEAAPRCSSHREALRALLRRACVSQPQRCWHGHYLLRGQPVPWEMLSSVSLASLSRCQ